MWVSRQQAKRLLRADPASSAAAGAGETVGAGEGAEGTRRGDAPEDSAPGGAEGRTEREGRYRLLEEIGRGGMGVVHRAIDRELGREVAIKMLRAEDAAHGHALERFQAEARTIAGLDHPGIVRIFDAGRLDGRPYFAMPLLRGRSLWKILEAGERPRPRVAAEWVRGIAEAVAHAHARGVIHRDLKPGNVLIDPEGRLHVLDFGLARQLGDARTITVSGEVLGTLRYMAPEQLEGERARIGPPADVWALGTILYELLTGAQPHPEEGMPTATSRRMPPVPPRRRDARIPADLETVCLACLRAEPERRYPTAREVADDLGRWLSGEAVLARPEAAWERALRRLRRHRAGVLLGACALAAALAAGIAQARIEGMRRERLGDLREIAARNLDAALTLRREGVRMPVAERLFLPPLRAAVERTLAIEPTLAEPCFRLGRMHRALLDFDRALEQQEEALRREPSHAGARYEHALLVARQLAGRLAAAGAMAAPPDEGPEARRWREALAADLEYLRSASDLAPAHQALVRGLQGYVAAIAGADAGEARRELRRAVELDPTLEEAYGVLADLEFRQSRFAEAVAALDEGIARDCGFAPHWLGRALARQALLIARGEGADAAARACLPDLERAVELAPERPWMLEALGRARYACALGRAERGEDAGPDFAAAEQALNAALGIAPGASSLLRLRGQLRRERARWGAPRGLDPEPDQAAAIVDFTGVIDSVPADAEAWRQRGATEGERAAHRDDPEADLRSAVADLEEAVRRAPDRADVRRDLGLVLADAATAREGRGEDSAGLDARAETAYAGALEREPADAATLLARAAHRSNVAGRAIRAGRDPGAALAGADADFSASLAHDPTLAVAWSGRCVLRTVHAQFRLARGEDATELLAGAEADATQAIERAPAVGLHWLRRGQARALGALARARSGRDPEGAFDDARSDLERAANLSPGDSQAWAGLAAISLNRGLYRKRHGLDPAGAFESALAASEPALKSVSRAPEVRELRAQALLELGRVEDAIREWESGAGDDPQARDRLRSRSLDLRRSAAREHCRRSLASDGAAAAAERERAWELLAPTVLAGDLDPSAIAADPELAPLPADARWGSWLSSARR